jgi:hypothetical protein
MSETFRVGDNVVRRCADGTADHGVGIGVVTASDVSHVNASFANGQLKVKVNAGNLALGGDGTLSLLKESDIPKLKAAQTHDELLEDIKGKLHWACDDSLRLMQAVIYEYPPTPRECQTCTFWRPPYEDYGPGNCHNQTVREFTRMGHETYPPPTSPEFGCNQWKAKQQPENGDDSDENG